METFVSFIRNKSQIHIVLLFVILLFAAFLRFYNLPGNPPGLYIDEVSSGYNGYLIQTKGVDEHGVSFPLWFEAFGEYKMPGLIYSIAASMAVFGKTDFAVRFPSALLGTASVILLFLFVKDLTKLDKAVFVNSGEKIALLSAFLLAISPWHLQFSRAGFDATIALFLFLLASWLFIRYWESNKFLFLTLSIISFAATFYTYNAYRFTTFAVMSLLFLLLYIGKKNRRHLFFGCLLFILVSVPVIQFSLTRNGLTRFQQTSAFAEVAAQTFLQKLFIYPMVFLKNYFTYFSAPFLFITGDGIGRHQVPGVGLLFRWQLPFLLYGIYYLFSRKISVTSAVIFGLLLIIPVSAALTRPSPHTLRSLLMVVPFMVIVAYGLFYMVSRLKRYVVPVGIFIIILAVYECILYLHLYTVHYSKVNILDWGGGYKQMVEKTAALKNRFDYIVVDNSFSFASIYFKFYDDSLVPIIVDKTWKKPEKWGNKKVLYIRPYYGPHSQKEIFYDVHLSNQNNDIIAQFWEI